MNNLNFNQCHKDNCSNEASKRSKYCVIHKRIFYKHIHPSESKIIENEIPTVIFENRLLKEDQDIEYHLALIQDIENREKEIKLQKLQEEIIQSLESFKLRGQAIPKEELIKIRFHLPNNKIIIESFQKDDMVKELFKYLDLVLYSTKTIDYKIVFYPNIVFDKSEKGEESLHKVGIYTNSRCSVIDLNK